MELRHPYGHYEWWKNVITNGKLPLKKFIEMELSLLPFTITTDTGDYSYIPEKD
jgi:hypothetical protein